jgi:hypothetical protein
MPNTPTLDLIVFDTHSLKSIAIADGSIYPSGFNTISPTLEVTPPNFATQSVAFTPNNIMIFNSNSLGITGGDGDTCLADLPDGIYHFKYSIAPAFTYFVEKTFLRVDALTTRLDEARLRLGTSQCDSQSRRTAEQKILDIEGWINGAISAGNQCALKLAMEWYKMASTMLTNFLSNQCCK